ncbi:MAG: DUF1501 domain-containing protein, partial [Planctomycetales bacterium]|nr:DUF1501 domain-containing protein [Planctomycetales bacterium]
MKPDAELLSPAGRDLLNRRGFLAHSATGLGALALTGLLDRDGLLAADEAWRPDIDPQKPHAARTGHYTGRAKQVLVIFCSGACSHVDTWDYKPELVRLDGQPMPGDAKLVTFQGENGALTKSPYAFRRRGQCGKFTSDLLPRLGEMVDDMCFVHSLTSKTNTHGPGENYMSTGFTLDGFPSVGAWTTYALGSECDDLPAFVAIPDPRGVPQSSINNWGPGFLPAMFQGTPFNAQQPIRYLQPPASISADEDLATRDFLRRLNERHLEAFPGDTTLAARIASYELAARMQLSVPEVSDLDSEPEHVLRMYGADDANTIKAGFARNCILARRLLER